MKKSMVTLLAGVCMAALLAGGCANKEAVKKEEAVVPVTTTTSPDAAKMADDADRLAAEETVVVTPAQEEAITVVSPEAAMIQAPVEVSLETVYFDFDKSDLRQDTRDVLSKNAEFILKSLPTAKIQIAGHTDERGSAEYNLALGERRAKSAQKYLTTLGVNSENLSLISYGKEKPAVEGSGEAAWAKNRRAEFYVVK